MYRRENRWCFFVMRFCLSKRLPPLCSRALVKRSSRTTATVAKKWRRLFMAANAGLISGPPNAAWQWPWRRCSSCGRRETSQLDRRRLARVRYRERAICAAPSTARPLPIWPTMTPLWCRLSKHVLALALALGLGLGLGLGLWPGTRVNGSILAHEIFEVFEIFEFFEIL